MKVKGYQAGGDGATMARVQPVIMFDTLDDAQEAIRQINKLRQGLCARIRAVERKRSWSDSVKAMTAGEFRIQLDFLQKLARAIGEAHSVGGY